MKKTFSLISAFLFVTLMTTSVFAAGDEATIKKLSSMYKSGDLTKAIVVPQDTKFAANVKKNILPNVNLPAGFSISLVKFNTIWDCNIFKILPYKAIL